MKWEIMIDTIIMIIIAPVGMMVRVIIRKAIMKVYATNSNNSSFNNQTNLPDKLVSLIK